MICKAQGVAKSIPQGDTSRMVQRPPGVGGLWDQLYQSLQVFKKIWSFLCEVSQFSSIGN